VVAFDNTILSLLLFPDAKLQGVEFARERVLGLMQKLVAAREQVLIPSPALCEALVTEGVDPGQVLEEIRKYACLRIGDFDQRAAIEMALRLRQAIQARDSREGLPSTKSAMKFDRQIVAIALVNGARVLYSDDAGVQKFAARCSLPVERTGDLPVPAMQNDLPFDSQQAGDSSGDAEKTE